MLRLVKYILLDIIQNRMVIGYALFLLAVSLGLFSLNDDPVKGLVSLLNIALIVTPLASIVFSTIHFYNSGEFIEVMAAQPVRRSLIIWAEFWSLSLALVTAVGIGMGIPVLIYAPAATGLALILATMALTVIFVSLAMYVSVRTRDKAKGIGGVLLLWFLFALLYDALVLLLMFMFSDYPFEKAVLALVALNPIDLARVTVLLQLDIAALMGYTGALFREFLGTVNGIVFASCILTIWSVLPVLIAVRLFNRKDL